MLLDKFPIDPPGREKIIEDLRAPTTPRKGGSGGHTFSSPICGTTWRRSLLDKMRDAQITSDEDCKMSDVDSLGECQPTTLRAHLGTQFIIRTLA
jgi:hypothetical protein